MTYCDRCKRSKEATPVATLEFHLLDERGEVCRNLLVEEVKATVRKFTTHGVREC